MKYTSYIPTFIVGVLTSFFIWIYVQRVNLNYNVDGRFFSPEDGVVYHKQAHEVYGILALLGLLLTMLFIIKLIRKKTQIVNKASTFHKKLDK